MAKKTITIDGKNVALLTQDESDYISLTDIAKLSDDEPRFVIRNWLSSQNTIAYLGAWESLHNPDFNRAGFRTVKDDFFEKAFSLTPSRLTPQIRLVLGQLLENTVVVLMPIKI
jgi:hypothetical protein